MRMATSTLSRSITEMKRLPLLLLVVALLPSCLKLETTIKEHKSVPSPDGRLVARALFADAGAVGSHDQLVLLTPASFEYKKDMEIKPFRIASMERVADGNIELIWNGPKALTIRFTQYGSGYVDYRSSHEGVEIFIEHIRGK